MQRRLLIEPRLRCSLALVGAALVSVVVSGSARADTAASCGPHLGGRLAAFAERHPTVHLAIAVRDLTDGHRYGLHGDARQLTASIVKVEILEALLHRHPNGLSPRLSERAGAMIRRSDNVAAQALYERIGGAAGLRAFGRVVGLRETAPAAGDGPGYAWGRTLSSANDQVRLLALLPTDNAVLSHGDRTFALRLMRHVVPDQRWGVTTGTGDSLVAVKNGWLPLVNGSSDWQINSIGYVHGSEARYLIAVESRGAPTMESGVQLVNAVSSIVARHC